MKRIQIDREKFNIQKVNKKEQQKILATPVIVKNVINNLGDDPPNTQVNKYGVFKPTIFSIGSLKEDADVMVPAQTQTYNLIPELIVEAGTLNDWGLDNSNKYSFLYTDGVNLNPYIITLCGSYTQLPKNIGVASEDTLNSTLVIYSMDYKLPEIDAASDIVYVLIRI